MSVIAKTRQEKSSLLLLLTIAGGLPIYCKLAQSRSSGYDMNPDGYAMELNKITPLTFNSLGKDFDASYPSTIFNHLTLLCVPL